MLILSERQSVQGKEPDDVTLARGCELRKLTLPNSAMKGSQACRRWRINSLRDRGRQRASGESSEIVSNEIFDDSLDLRSDFGESLEGELFPFSNRCFDESRLSSEWNVERQLASDGSGRR